MTNLELNFEIFRSKEMHHPRDPALFLRHLLDIIRLLTSPITRHTTRHRPHSTTQRSRTRNSLVPLISHEYMTQLQQSLYVLWGIDRNLIFEY